MILGAVALVLMVAVGAAVVFLLRSAGGGKIAADAQFISDDTDAIMVIDVAGARRGKLFGQLDKELSLSAEADKHLGEKSGLSSTDISTVTIALTYSENLKREPKPATMTVGVVRTTKPLSAEALKTLQQWVPPSGCECGPHHRPLQVQFKRESARRLAATRSGAPRCASRPTPSPAICRRQAPWVFRPSPYKGPAAGAHGPVGLTRGPVMNEPDKVLVFGMPRADLRMQAAWLLGPAVCASAVSMWTGEPVMAAGAAGLLLLPLMVMARRLCQVRLEPDGVAVRGMRGRPRRIAWTQLAGVTVSGGIGGRRITLRATDGRTVAVPSGIEDFDRLALELTGRVPGATGAAGDPGPRPLRAILRLAGSLLMAAWAAAVGWGVWRFTATGNAAELLPILLSGAAVPGLAYLMVRSRPGSLAICWAAAQVCLWATVPLALWAVLWAQPLTLFSLTGWLAAAFALAAAASSSVLPAPARRPGGGEAAGTSGQALLVLLFLAAGVGAWRLSETTLSLPAEARGAFTAPEDFRIGDAAALTVLAEPRNGKWVCLAAARVGGEYPVIPLGRAPIDEAGDAESFLFLDVYGGQPGRAVLWSPDGGAAAVLCGTGTAGAGTAAAGLHVTEVQFVWWDDRNTLRTSRVFHSAAGGYPYRGAAWSPDGRRLAILLAVGAKDTDARLHVLDSGGGNRNADKYIAGDCRLVAWRADGKLVLERPSEEGSSLIAEYISPDEVPAPPRPAAADVGPPDPNESPKPKPKTKPASPGAKRDREPPPAPKTGVPMTVTDRRLARSPNGRYVVSWSPADKGFRVWDHQKGEAIAISAPAAGPELDKLPPGAEARQGWSGDGSTVLLPPVTGKSKVIVLSIGRREASVIDLPVPPAALSNYRLSHDGRRFAFLAELGSANEWARQSRAALAAIGLMPADEQPTPRGPMAAAEAPPGFALLRSVMVAELTGPDQAQYRRVNLLPAGRGLDAAGETPDFLWPADEPALYVLLRRPHSAEQTRQIYRVAMPGAE